MKKNIDILAHLQCIELSILNFEKYFFLTQE